MPQRRLGTATSQNSHFKVLHLRFFLSRKITFFEAIVHIFLGIITFSVLNQPIHFHVKHTVRDYSINVPQMVVTKLYALPEFVFNAQ